MYFTICLFSRLPKNYDFPAAVMKVFNISDDELLLLLVIRACNILIFAVDSEDVFIRVSELHYSILYFPVNGLNVLQCYAYPKTSQILFFEMSPFQGKDMTQIVSELGLVLYKRLISKSGPLASDPRKDCIGVVLLMNERSYRVAMGVFASPTSQYGQGAVGPSPYYEPVAGHSSAAPALQQPFAMPAYSLHSGCPCEYQGQQVNTFQTPGARRQ